DIDDHLIALVDPADERGISPGRALLPADLDGQRVGADHGSAAKLQHQPAGNPSPGPASARIASQTSTIAVRLAARTLSCGVWSARVPLGGSPVSTPVARKALASLPPPVAPLLTLWPQASSAADPIRTASESSAIR